jgi:Protein of unknown function (DUF2695)
VREVCGVSERKSVLRPDPYDSEWNEFFDELMDELSKSFCTRRPRLAALLLERRGYDVEATLTLLEAHGGYCDCEITLNIDLMTLEDELDMLTGEGAE